MIKYFFKQQHEHSGHGLDAINGQYYLDAKTTKIFTMNDLFRYCYMDTKGKE